MSKSKSRQLSKQASSTAKSRARLSEAPKDTVQLTEEAKDTTQLAEDTQETSPLAEDTSEDQTSTSGTLANGARKQQAVTTSRATGAKEQSASSTSKQATNSAKEKPAAAASKKVVASAKEKQSSTTSKQTATARAQPPIHRPLTRDGAKYERRQAERQSRFLAERRAKRVRNTVITVIALAVILGGSLTAYFIYNARQGSAQAANTPQAFQEPIFDSDFQPVDNVYCDQLEQTVEHIHVHLTIYIDGQNFPLPANIGIATNPQTQQATCFYWLHVHQQNPGVIHIEAPTTEPFTLGQFLNEWDQQFNSLGFPPELTLKQGWTTWVNGKPFHGDLHNVTLSEHDLITIAYNSPNVKPDKIYNWGAQNL